jgi:hypothetical protein
MPTPERSATFVNESVVPDIYADSTQISTTPYGVTITLGRTPPHHSGPTPPIAEKLTVVRMSMEHAKVVAMLLRKQLKAFERANGEIPLPPELYATLGVAREDWGL